MLIAVASSVAGYFAAVALDVSIGGMMASMTGVFLALSFTLSPKYGLVVQERRRRRQLVDNAERLLLVHLYNHEALEQAEENHAVALRTHLRWSPLQAEAVLRGSLRRGLILRRLKGTC